MWNKRVSPWAYLYVLVVGVVLFFAVTRAFPHESPPPYITVDTLNLTFTEREYHQRVRRQIEQYGFNTMCVEHLLTLDPAAKTYDVNHARQNLVLVTECAREEQQ